MESHTCDLSGPPEARDAASASGIDLVALGAVDGLPGLPDWGPPQVVLCGGCDAESQRVPLALVTQRLTRTRTTLLVPACAAPRGEEAPADVVRLELAPGDWTLWVLQPVHGRERRRRRGSRIWVAVLTAPLQFVRCGRCRALVRLDADDLRRQGPPTRALVA